MLLWISQQVSLLNGGTFIFHSHQLLPESWGHCYSLTAFQAITDSWDCLKWPDCFGMTYKDDTFCLQKLLFILVKNSRQMTEVSLFLQCSKTTFFICHCWLEDRRNVGEPILGFKFVYPPSFFWLNHLKVLSVIWFPIKTESSRSLHKLFQKFCKM